MNHAKLFENLRKAAEDEERTSQQMNITKTEEDLKSGASISAATTITSINYKALLEIIIGSNKNKDRELKRYAIEMAPTSISVSLGLLQLIENQTIRNSTLQALQDRRYPTTPEYFGDLCTIFLEQLKAVCPAIMNLSQTERDQTIQWLNTHLTNLPPQEFPDQLIPPEMIPTNLITEIEKIGTAENSPQTFFDLDDECEIRDAAMKYWEERDFFNFLLFFEKIKHSNFKFKVYNYILTSLINDAIESKSYNVIFLILKSARKNFKANCINGILPSLTLESANFARQIVTMFAYGDAKLMEKINLEERLETGELVKQRLSYILEKWHALNVSLPHVAGNKQECARLLQPFKDGTFLKAQGFSLQSLAAVVSDKLSPAAVVSNEPSPAAGSYKKAPQAKKSAKKRSEEVKR